MADPATPPATPSRRVSAIAAWLAGGRHSSNAVWRAFSWLADSLTKRVGDRRVPRASGSWAYLFAIVSWVVIMVRQLPCRYTDGGSRPDVFGWMCYSDIYVLYFDRGQATGALPYVGATWEYPVLTGYFAGLANTVARLFGAQPDPGVDGQQMVDNANIYFGVTSVALFCCLLWLIHSVSRIVPDQPGLAMLIAISPAVWTTGLINWDLLVVALTAAGLAAWQERKPGWAGLWLGLGVAAKLYPLVIIGAFFILAIRPGVPHKPDPEGPHHLGGPSRRSSRAMSPARLREWATMASVAAVVWVLANLPVMLTRFDDWKTFYAYNSTRGADLGSFWYSLTTMGLTVPHPIAWSRTVMILGFLALALVTYLVPTPPSAIQVAYLAVAIMTVSNTVYSPQYVLWLLPLIVLARPKTPDMIVFAAAELVYYVFIWLYLRSNDLSLGLTEAPWLYIWSIWVRVAATVWLMARVVRDLARGQIIPPNVPEHEIILPRSAPALPTPPINAAHAAP